MLDKENIVCSILSGIEEADRQHKLMTGGLSIQLAPEYYMSVHIAQAMARCKLPNEIILFEQSPKATLAALIA